MPFGNIAIRPCPPLLALNNLPSFPVTCIHNQVIMLRSITDVNLPKFLPQDLLLFNGIVSDLFPGVHLPASDHAALHAALQQTKRQCGLQIVPKFLEKVFQIYEMLRIRHGAMIVGYSYAGKTMALSLLSKALTLMSNEGREEKCVLYCLNPKVCTRRICIIAWCAPACVLCVYGGSILWLRLRVPFLLLLGVLCAVCCVLCPHVSPCGFVCLDE